MSYTKIVIFKDGLPTDGVEYRNAWGGAARIWNSLFEKYVPKEHEYDTWLTTNNGNDSRLWDLAKKQEIPMAERAVHAFTFDHFYISNKNFKRFAGDLRSFVSRYPRKDKVDHLSAWAEWFDNSEAEAAGLYATSVSENPWCRYSEEDSCNKPVFLSEGTEVYNWLARIDKESCL